MKPQQHLQQGNVNIKQKAFVYLLYSEDRHLDRGQRFLVITRWCFKPFEGAGLTQELIQSGGPHPRLYHCD